MRVCVYMCVLRTFAQATQKLTYPSSAWKKTIADADAVAYDVPKSDRKKGAQSDKQKASSKGTRLVDDGDYSGDSDLSSSKDVLTCQMVMGATVETMIVCGTQCGHSFTAHRPDAEPNAVKLIARAGR